MIDSINSKAAKAALKKLWSDIDQSMIQAFDEGYSFFAVEKQLRQQDNDPFGIFDIWEKQTVKVALRAGPLNNLEELPSGFRVAARPHDWDTKREEYINGRN